MGLPRHELAAGVARDLAVTLVDPDTGDSYATDRWASGDTLAASVWRGDTQASAFSPTAAWVSASAGTIRVTIAAASTASLDAGRYLLRVTAADASDSGRVFEVYRAALDLLPSPGSGTQPDTYCSYDDMRSVAGAWLADLHDPDAGQSGYAEQRAEARRWTDAAIQRHYRRGTYGPRQDSLDHLLDGVGYTRLGEHDTTLQAWLDDDRLVLTTPAGRDIVRANAYYAVSLVCAAQIGPNDGDTNYQRLARRFRGEAGNTLRQVVAEVDTTTVADGVGDLFIDLSVVDRLGG